MQNLAKISGKIIKIGLNLADKAWFVVIISLLVNFNFPHLTVAQGLDIPTASGQENYFSLGSLPEIGEGLPYKTVKIWVSAYNSQPSQTDSSPCITASGLNVCERGAEDIIATNFMHLPFGAKVRFPELFGGKIFIVHDRMNVKYSNTMDIWLKDYDEAVSFGRQYTIVEIF